MKIAAEVLERTPEWRARTALQNEKIETSIVADEFFF